MKIIPLAFDSLGTRSMATYVETPDCSILIDPGVALGPYRYGLTPHPLEVMRLNEHWKSIVEYAARADVLTLSHYHYDHHDPNEPELFRNRVLLIKHPTENINRSQKERAEYFLNVVKKYPKKLEIADSNTFKFGVTKLKFSAAVPHGPSNRLGYVVQLCIEHRGEKFVHTSDVEGPSLDEQLNFLLEMRPQTVICDGPMTYMLGYRYSRKSLEMSERNLCKLVATTELEHLVIDHHFLRDLKWKEKIEKLVRSAEKHDVKLKTAAEYLGVENELLEANRARLYKEHKDMKMPAVHKKIAEE